VSRLALVEAEVEKLCAAAASAEEAAERANSTTAATETTAGMPPGLPHEARVTELERDLGTATMDLATVGRQFSQVTNQLQVVSEEATRLRENNAKLSEDLVGESRGCFLSLSSFATYFLSRSELLVMVAGARVIRAGMTAKLAEQNQELNAALLKVIEQDGAIGRLSEQLQSKCRILTLSPPFP
jgi:hypothetical protein